MLVNSELERMWKEAVVALCETLSLNLHSGTEEILEIYAKVDGVVAEIQR